ncbi:related to PAM16 - Presequence translocase-Associated Motor [Melanopsichium pennsylvanicum]|uniref:Mitochondrial import inner membrane translocase subunit TIM16 n=2 Tax=Melanopsichium pennsylvanicum TaxID=63383 RepID=A0AAJ4XN99_9BASI|nr:related to PAM16-Presequence translocase-Asssociated Motor [Melanopsichium pennsylvanicum 4]SNX86049.1 related to PAM16 - Presequence translocase-Associated Motor [Melanopsichium pennsylvanicum]
MSLPKTLAQILFVGTQIVGKALLEAGRQAGRNARAGRVEASAAGAAGVGSGSAASPSDQLTRTHRMTLDEAKLILNLKQDVSAVGLGTASPAAGAEGNSILDQVREAMVKNYDHLFATNAPPAPKGAKGGGAGSFYIQSKVVRARERIEAELGLLGTGNKAEGEATEAPKAEGSDKADKAT